ncbi:MAG: transmembrane sensor [Parvibaculaceae bacterium]|jgi:transmembrane sensor
MMGSEKIEADATLEAARWLVALEDASDDKDLHANFNLWLQASPENAAAWADTSAVYDMMGYADPTYEDQWPEKAAQQGSRSWPLKLPVLTVVPAQNRRFVSVLVGGLAACLVLLMGPTVLVRLEADHMTDTAEVRSLQLEDGSLLSMGPETAIALDYTAAERRLHLLAGEVFLHVKPNKQRPFRVIARNVTTTVLGTAFNVHLGDEGATVRVRQGLVGVGYGNEPSGGEQLTPGDWAQVDEDGAFQRGHGPGEEVGVWTDGQIVVRDRPLSEVADDLRRYYPGLIVLRGSGLSEQRVSGVYNLSDPVAALRAVVSVHGGVVHQVTPWVLLVTRG